MLVYDDYHNCSLPTQNGRWPNTHLLGGEKGGFAAGKWDGSGGKVKPHETIEQAAVREVKEELGVEVRIEDLQPIATINFAFTDKPEQNQQTHAYFVDYWEGEPSESEEMRPEWYLLEDIPYDQMWLADKYWLPRVLQGEKLKAEFTYGPQEQIEHYNILPVNLHELVL